MFLYSQKAHISEVQASIWPDELYQAASEQGVHIY